MNQRSSFILVCICLLFVCTGCGSTAAPTAIESVEPAENLSSTATEASPPTATSETATQTEAPLAALPAEPQEIHFEASDGTPLEGYYYPAALNPAPLVVLMHWPNGNMHDWNEIAVWLQNRGLANPFENPINEAWWDESWFPQMPTGDSYGVLIFNFRDSVDDSAENPQIDPGGWLDDAQSAMLLARGLEGVDPERILSIGSAHGGDGAIDGCLYLNQQFPGSCAGTLALSPGSFLTLDYPETVNALGEISPNTRVGCIGMELEISICEYAASLGNPVFEYHSIPGMFSGNGLLQNGIDPLPMQLMLNFVEKSLK